MFFQFQLSALSRQLFSAMRGPEQTLKKASEPATAFTEREQREIAALEALYGLPALLPPHERGLAQSIARYPGRLFVFLTVIFATSALCGV